jgi:hypothetical protein
MQLPIEIKSGTDLVRAVRNVLGLICGSHPSVLPIRGWNLKRDAATQALSLVLIVGSHRPFEKIEGREEDFVFRILRGMSHLHSLAITHGNMGPSSICLDSESNPRIFDFGLVGDKPFLADLHPVRATFCEVLRTIPPIAEAWVTVLCSFDRAVMKICPQKLEGEAGLGGFPLDLLLTLSGDPELWKGKDAEDADPGAILSRVTLGLDERGRAQFAAVVRDMLATVGCLEVGRLDAFEAAQRERISPPSAS